LKTTIRENPTDSFRDAAALVVLILLALTVRLGPQDDVGDLVPAAEAAQSAADTADPEPAPAMLGSLVDPGARPIPRVRVLALDETERVLTLATDPAGDLDAGNTLCRIERGPTGIEASCARVAEARPRALPACAAREHTEG